MENCKKEKNNLAKSVLEKLKKANIKPRSHWSFLAKDYAVWFLGATTLLLGSVAFSVLVYMERHNDWEVYENINDSLLAFILVTLPYFWVLLLMLLIFASYYNLKHTKKGYKYRITTVVVGSFVFTLFLGVAFYNVGLGRLVDDVLSEKAPFYEKVINHRMHSWLDPESGRMTGVIIYVEEPEEFILKDLSGVNWDVDYKEAIIFPGIIINEGEKIKILGNLLDNQKFRAEKVMPVGPGRGMHNRIMTPEIMDMNNICSQFNMEIENMPMPCRR